MTTPFFVIVAGNEDRPHLVRAAVFTGPPDQHRRVRGAPPSLAGWQQVVLVVDRAGPRRPDGWHGRVIGVINAVPSPQVDLACKACDLGLQPLNAAQQRAATLILSSADRTILIQGVSGAGKSAALQPVARIAEEEGRPVLGLAIAGTIAQKLATDTGAPAMTIARFTAQHRGRP